jgi:general nucleoside transport system ATP-binding protein
MLAVHMENISKRFGAMQANDNVSLDIAKGSVHAIVGENGAGKSTLMSILYGLYRPERGTISIHGKPERIDSPAKAIQLGIGMVHQHFMLVPPLTVTENIILGKEPIRFFGVLDLTAAERDIRNLSELYHLIVDPKAQVSSLSVGIQQRIEILKILYRQANILILDEPTAVLTPQEIDDLFRTLLDLKRQNKTVVLITHKLNEVMTISDNVTVMRRGQVVGNLETGKTSAEELTQLMVGRNIEAPTRRISKASPVPLLRVMGVSAQNANSFTVLHDVSFSVSGGEILGIAGVEGNGQTELIEVLTRLRTPFSGIVMIADINIVKLAHRVEIAHIPEDRWKRGLVLDFPVSDNCILGRQRNKGFSRGLFLLKKKIDDYADQLISRFDIRPPDKRQLARRLSGGNQQKVVIARELSKETTVIIASQPTRGLDIGAIEYVHNAILAERNRGKAVVLVSSDLGELFKLSDRIAVMYKGQLSVIKKPSETNEREIGHFMTGGASRVAV